MDTLEKMIDKQAEFAVGLKLENISAEAVERARWIILDSMGCIIKGLQGKKISFCEQEQILELAVAMISTELYEGNRKAVGHPSCHILPLMFVQGKAGQIRYGEFIKNFVASYEIAARWGRSILFSHDVLGHGTVMTSGAVVAEALFQKMEKNELYHSLLLAGSLPEVSVWQSVFDGSVLHDVYAGLSALTAQKSIWMSRKGMRSTGKIITAVYHDIMGASIMEEKLSPDDEYLLCSNYFKVHTGCRFVHPFADLLQTELEHGLNKNDVAEINVYTYKKAARLSSQEVPNDLAAKFSIPVSLAVQLEKGILSPDSIRSCERDPAVKKWEGHIWLHEDEQYNKLLPDTRGGRMEITLKDGRILKREVYHAEGDFDNPEPYTKEKLIRKFRENTKEYLAKEEQDTLIETVLEDTGMDSNCNGVFAVFYKTILEVEDK